MTFREPRSWPANTPLNTENLNTWVRDQQVALKALIDHNTLNHQVRIVNLDADQALTGTFAAVDGLACQLTVPKQGIVLWELSFHAKGGFSGRIYVDGEEHDSSDAFNGNIATTNNVVFEGVITGLDLGSHTIEPRFRNKGVTAKIESDYPIFFRVTELKDSVVVDGSSVSPSPVVDADPILFFRGWRLEGREYPVNAVRRVEEFVNAGRIVAVIDNLGRSDLTGVDLGMGDYTLAENLSLAPGLNENSITLDAQTRTGMLANWASRSSIGIELSVSDVRLADGDLVIDANLIEPGDSPGALVAYAGTSPPLGWIPCDGRALKRSDYPALFAVIGTQYGLGDGSTTFNIPNLTARPLRYAIRV